MSAPSLLPVALLWAGAVMTPGPNFLVAARVSAGQSRLAALGVVLGIGAGTAVWLALGFLGVQAAFAAVPWLYAGLKLLGGAYLLLLGLRLVRAAPGAMAVPRGGGAFRAGVLTSLSNPKSALFVASLFATVMPAHPSFGFGVSAVCLMLSMTLGWYSVVTLVLTTRRAGAAYGRMRGWIDRLAGGVFMLFGVRLLVSS